MRKGLAAFAFVALAIGAGRAWSSEYNTYQFDVRENCDDTRVVQSFGVDESAPSFFGGEYRLGVCNGRFEVGGEAKVGIFDAGGGAYGKVYLGEKRQGLYVIGQVEAISGYPGNYVKSATSATAGIGYDFNDWAVEGYVGKGHQDTQDGENRNPTAFGITLNRAF